MGPRDDDRLLDLPQSAAAAGCSEHTLRRWIAAGKFPPPDVAPNSRTTLWWASTVAKHTPPPAKVGAKRIGSHRKAAEVTA
jgi:predicted DNA-binding transcriptional regulator AlpA